MSALVLAVLVGPVIGLVAVVFVRLIAFVSHYRARGKLVLVAPLGAFGVLAGIGQFFPQVFGNGKGIALDAFLATAGCCCCWRCSWSSRWSSLVGAAAMPGAGIQAPLTAVVLVLELTHSGFRVDGPAHDRDGAGHRRRTAGGRLSIYSGRLAARSPS